MKRIALVILLIPSFGLAMQDGKGESPNLHVKKTDAKADAVIAGAEAKPVTTTSSNTSTEAKKGLLARCFVCCNGKSETK